MTVKKLKTKVTTGKEVENLCVIQMSKNHQRGTKGKLMSQLGQWRARGGGLSKGGELRFLVYTEEEEEETLSPHLLVDCVWR